MIIQVAHYAEGYRDTATVNIQRKIVLLAYEWNLSLTTEAVNVISDEHDWKLGRQRQGQGY